jgi:hypothetical protein
VDVKHPLNEGEQGCADFIFQFPGEKSGLVHRSGGLLWSPVPLERQAS